MFVCLGSVMVRKISDSKDTDKLKTVTVTEHYSIWKYPKVSFSTVQNYPSHILCIVIAKA